MQTWRDSLHLAKAKQLDQYVEEKDTNQTQSDTFLRVWIDPICQIKSNLLQVKITGARWKTDNTSQILRLRTAYLNHSPLPSICA